MANERRAWGRWIVVLAWAVGLAWWSFTPLTDSVPTGLVDDKATFAKFECSAPIDGSARPPSFTLPELEAPRLYTRPPCEQTYSVNRRMLVVNVFLLLLLVVACAALSFVEIRRRRSGEPSAVPVAAGP